MSLPLTYLYRRRKHTEPQRSARPIRDLRDSMEARLQPPRLLLEVSFKQLINFTDQNGHYLSGGGMRRVAGHWIIDPSVPGRSSNSRFVVTTPPKVRREGDGCVSVIFNFKSRPDRSTTGLRQRGYVKFMPDRRAKYQFGNKVHVFCTCSDFKYRSHKVLSDLGASHTPSGIGGEATNADPVITNPSKLPFLCKHLVAVAAYLSARRADYNNIIKKLGQQPGAGVSPSQPKPKPKPAPAAEPKPDPEDDAEQTEPDQPDRAAAAPQKPAKSAQPAPKKASGKPAKPDKELKAVPKEQVPKMRKGDQAAKPEDEENLDIEKPDEDEDDDEDLT